MVGYISSVIEGDAPVELVEIDGEAGVYRADDEDGHVHLRTDDEDVDLGVPDVNVSRIRPDAQPACPVRIFEEERTVYVRNEFNGSKVHVNHLTDRLRLDEGERAELDRDCVVEPGSITALRVTIPDTPAATDDGVSPVVTVNALCKGFVAASRDSGPEALEFGRNLLSVIRDNPLDHEDFETARRDLERAVSNLRARSVPSGEELNEERIREHERIANHLETLYELRS